MINVFKVFALLHVVPVVVIQFPLSLVVVCTLSQVKRCNVIINLSFNFTVRSNSFVHPQHLEVVVGRRSDRLWLSSFRRYLSAADIQFVVSDLLQVPCLRILLNPCIDRVFIIPIITPRCISNFHSSLNYFLLF